MRIRSKPIQLLTHAEREILRGLTNGGWGSMQYHLDRDLGERAIMAIEDNQIVGWALLHADGVTHFFVHKDWRRKGIGTLLYNHTQRFGEVLACPCNDVNRKFFRKLDAKVASGFYM